MLELFGVSGVGNLTQPLEQNRQHLAHDQDQPGYRLGARFALLFDVRQGRLTVRWGGSRVRDQPGFTLLAAQLALLVFFFSPAL